MERVTVSSSIKFKDQIRNVIEKCTELGIVAVFPNLDSNVKKVDVDLAFMQKLEAEHFEAIDGSEGLYVVCPSGYVGTLDSVEIGYAFAQNKPVIFSEEPGDLGLQAISSAYISMNQLERLKEITV